MREARVTRWLGQHRTENPGVGGSIPSQPTNFNYLMLAVWRDSDEDAGEGRRGELVKAMSRYADLVLVAELGRLIVGVIVGTTDGLWGYPRRLIVRPTHRRQGIGRSLVTELERRYRARGIYRLNVLIRVGNAASMALSAGLGYEHEETITVWTRTIPDEPSAVQR